MKDKLEVGMYVKFKTLSNQVKVGQIQLIDNSIYELDNNEVTADKYIVKATHNIIDLIEVGDYVNGSKVIKTNCKLEYIDDDSDTGVNEVYDGLETEKNFIYFEYEIETIVTKEQFESIKYSLER